MDETLKIHPFERTLGPGPYRFVGTFDLGACLGALQAGNVNAYNNGLAMAPRLESGMGTCSHCGHAITMICIVKTGEGKLYGVGSDCIAKVDMPAQEITAFKKAMKRVSKAKREIAKLHKWEMFTKFMFENAEALDKVPHPYRNNSCMTTSTALDYAEWCLCRRSDRWSCNFSFKKVKESIK